MANDSKPSTTTDVMEDTDNNLVQIFVTHMKKASNAQPIFDPEALERAQNDIIHVIISGLGKDDAGDISHLLRAYGSHIMERDITTSCHVNQNDSTGIACMHLTYDWIPVVTFTESIGNKQVAFCGSNAKPSGFNSRMFVVDGKLIWGSEYEELRKDPKFKSEDLHRLFSRLHPLSRSFPEKKSMIANFFQQAKAHLCAEMQENISQVIIVLPSRFEFRDRCYLQERLSNAGFLRVVFVDDSALAAFRVFATMSPSEQYERSILVISVDAENYSARLEIFGCDDSSNNFNGVKLLAVASGSYVMTHLKEMYDRVLKQLPVQRKNSVSHYVVLSDVQKYYPFDIAAADHYFGQAKMLQKAEDLSGDNLLQVFSQFSGDPCKLDTFLNTSCAAPLEEYPDFPFTPNLRIMFFEGRTSHREQVKFELESGELLFKDNSNSGKADESVIEIQKHYNSVAIPTPAEEVTQTVVEVLQTVISDDTAEKTNKTPWPFNKCHIL